MFPSLRQLDRVRWDSKPLPMVQPQSVWIVLKVSVRPSVHVGCRTIPLLLVCVVCRSVQFGWEEVFELSTRGYMQGWNQHHTYAAIVQQYCCVGVERSWFVLHPAVATGYWSGDYSDGELHVYECRPDPKTCCPKGKCYALIPDPLTDCAVNRT